MKSPVLLSLPFAPLLVQALPNPFASQKADQGMKIPIAKSSEYLAKRSREDVDLDWLLGSREFVKFKYGPFSRINGRAVGSEPLSAQGSLWMGPISIGSSTFQIDFDTGSADLFVPADTCNDGGCVGHSKFSPTSSTVKKQGNFSIQYGDGSSSSGPIYQDNMSIAGVSITSQTFSAVTKMSDSFVKSKFPADGLAGMGFQALAHTYSPPFFQTMISQGVVSSPFFSFRIAQKNSELSHFNGPLVYTPVTQKLYWKIDLGGAEVNGNPVSIAGTNAIVDTGTTLAYGSYSDVAAIWSSVPGSVEMAQSYGPAWKGYYLFPCNSIPTLSFSIGGSFFSIPPSAMNLGRISSGSSQCVGAMVGQDPTSSGLENTYLFGDAFLQGQYAVFDVGNGRMGFAPSSDYPISSSSSSSRSSTISSSSARSSSGSKLASSTSSLRASTSSLRPSSSILTTSFTPSLRLSSSSTSHSTSTSTSISAAGGRSPAPAATSSRATSVASSSSFNSHSHSSARPSSSMVETCAEGLCVS